MKLSIFSLNTSQVMMSSSPGTSCPLLMILIWTTVEVFSGRHEFRDILKPALFLRCGSQETIVSLRKLWKRRPISKQQQVWFSCQERCPAHLLTLNPSISKAGVWHQSTLFPYMQKPTPSYPSGAFEVPPTRLDVSVSPNFSPSTPGSSPMRWGGAGQNTEATHYKALAVTKLSLISNSSTVLYLWPGSRIFKHCNSSFQIFSFKICILVSLYFDASTETPKLTSY